MPSEITLPFPNFLGFSQVWEWIINFIPYNIMDVVTYPCWKKLIHVSKSDPNDIATTNKAQKSLCTAMVYVL